jgi:glycosyltransferase involved in cell wall biosynthesis
LIQGSIGKWLLYQLILPNTNHIFVQSDNMRDVLAQHGIDVNKMTPVPMGVDLEAINQRPEPLCDPLFTNKRVLVYLGTLDKTRQIELLFEVIKQIKPQVPNVLLVLAGDTEDASHRTWLQQQATNQGVVNEVLWTGWLPTEQAWRYVVSAEIGLSPFPRGLLLDMASPTKAVEYMALGLPVVANDNPDQATVISDSGAGLCVAMTAEAFAVATLKLLNDAKLREKMSALGRQYTSNHRGYAQLADSLALRYKSLV